MQLLDSDERPVGKCSQLENGLEHRKNIHIKCHLLFLKIRRQFQSMQSELFYREDNGRRRAHIKYRIVEIVQQTGKNVKIASVFIFLGVIEISFC